MSLEEEMRIRWGEERERVLAAEREWKAALDRIATLERERAEMVGLLRKLHLVAAECLGFQDEECGGHLPRNECVTNAADVYDWTNDLLSRYDAEAKG